MGDLHSAFKCPCGTEFGESTDHPQVERLCEVHSSGSGYRGGEPVYAPGKAAPEEFAAFKEQNPEKFQKSDERPEKRARVIEKKK